jgi:chromosome segregation ATPase
MENRNNFDKAFSQLEQAEKQLAEENRRLAKLKGEEQEQKRDLEALEDEVRTQARILAPLKEEIQECQAERGQLEDEFARKEAELKKRTDARLADAESRLAQGETAAAAREKALNEKIRELKDEIAQKEKEMGDMRHLLLKMKDESEANYGRAVLKEREWAEMKKEVENAKAYIETLHTELKEKEQAVLSMENDIRAKLAEGVRTDLGLTGEADRAREILEGERKEFKAHYEALEREFEQKEKELMDEVQALKEADTKRSLEYQRMSMELNTARERQEAAESKASSASIEMMELNVYNKSAAAALREKDAEISDLKLALENARSDAARAR